MKDHKSPAAKALSLKKDAIFRLLVVMLVLLGWLAGLGASAVLGVQNIYSRWELEQSTTLNVYLPATTPGVAVESLNQTLLNEVGVTSVKLVDQAEILNILEPYLGEETSQPLPRVLEVTVGPNLDQESLKNRVHGVVPEATIDDARQMLDEIARAVRVAQILALVLSIVAFVVVAMLVALTVRAGLRSQSWQVRIMQYIGATDSFLAKMVTGQVLRRGVIGWVGGSILGALTLLALRLMWPSLGVYMTPLVWAGIVLGPLVLMLVAGAVALVVARRVVEKNADA